MRTLFHMPLDPASRAIRFAMAEKGLPAQLVEKRPWADEDGTLAAANPAGAVPVLIDEPPTGGEIAVSPASAIIEYLEEAYESGPLLPATSAGRAEARRLSAWFLDKFEAEVSVFTLRERVDKRLMRRGQPDYELLKAGADALAWHLDYAAWLLDQRHWLAGEKMTIADIAAAAQLSALDYIDFVPWEKFPPVKDWYARLKSRPAMRPILRDRIDGLPPPAHYDNPDF
ncbi:glutathione S-transferase family protein [Hyphococcus luteus]|jgi:glutathione S-transferase|uniref:Glutathione S-transferase n=1 Tax=Hyphococcus luteus TaxID=2058213 RepID=A0A2S7K494_9PROT|nr:glutathione S-transferase family protein [Marinicaulis flavus]PQA87306.1 glutathione S-transferase [Marinicaulis flavus]